MQWLEGRKPVWQAVEENGRIRQARDTETGAFMHLRGTSEAEVEEVVATLPGEHEFRFTITLKPLKGSFAGDDSSNPMIKIYVSSFLRMIGDRGKGTCEENSILIRYLLQGLAEINRKWPLCGSPYFYSDLAEHMNKGFEVFGLDFPSDQELSRL